MRCIGGNGQQGAEQPAGHLGRHPGAGAGRCAPHGLPAHRVEVLRETPGTAVLAVTIHEGKNRQVRRMCAQCGLTLKRLRRVREGALELGDLPPGKWRYLTQDEAGALGVTP